MILTKENVRSFTVNNLEEQNDLYSQIEGLFDKIESQEKTINDFLVEKEGDKKENLVTEIRIRIDEISLECAGASTAKLLELSDEIQKLVAERITL